MHGERGEDEREEEKEGCMSVYGAERRKREEEEGRSRGRRGGGE